MIDPNRLYSFSQACRLLPSCRGTNLHIKTLHRWRVEGRFVAQSRQSGKIRYWFVLGSELVRLCAQPAAELAAVQDVAGDARRRRMDWRQRLYDEAAVDAELDRLLGPRR